MLGWGVLLLLGAVVALNWTVGRLPATPTPTGKFAQLAGMRIRYLERPGAEPAVLLIHGLPGTAEDFQAVTPLLAGHRTVAIDRPGYGFSTSGYFPFPRQLQAVHEVVEKLHLGHPILVGHSYGGSVSLGYAERYPNGVRGLVLVDAAATCTHNSVFARAQAKFAQLIELPVVSQVANLTFSQLVRTASAEPTEKEAFSPNPVDPRHHEHVMSVILKHGNLKAYGGEVQAANGVIEKLNRGLSSVHVPAIVLQGDRDKLVKPQCGRKLAARLPGAKLEMLSGGHMVPYTHPAAVAAAVQSLSATGKD